jgi:ABC-type transport system substrate-binding protein
MLEHNFDLAYAPFDYANDTYWIGGLLDPDAKGRGERNYMGFVPDRTLAQLLQRMRTKRDFHDPINGLRRQMQQFYMLFGEQMPFVPLWQLDFHIIVNGNLNTSPLPQQLDPLSIFSQVEEWRVNR